MPFRADWKNHKAMCRRVQASKRDTPPEVQRMSAALDKWTWKNSSVLDLAAYEAMLPSIGYLDHHLLDTHAMVYEVEENADKAGDFRFISAKLITLTEFAEMYEGNELATANFRDSLKLNKKVMNEHNAQMPPWMAGERLVGYAYSRTDCAGHTFERGGEVQQKRLDQWKKKKHVEDWEGWLRETLTKLPTTKPKKGQVRLVVPPGMND